ncbi:MAG: DUF485 domain-containing protein [Henriciella sp.]|nr:DUF485 domain-containing protein [Henriciella sp.]
MTRTEYIQKKRAIVFSLSAITTLLFLAFLCVIAMAPDAASGTLIILTGFVLIIGSCVAVTLYGVWANRFQQELSLDGDEHA